MLGAMSEKKKRYMSCGHQLPMGPLIGGPNVTCQVLYITLFDSG